MEIALVYNSYHILMFISNMGQGANSKIEIKTSVKPRKIDIIIYAKDFDVPRFVILSAS